MARGSVRPVTAAGTTRGRPLVGLLAALAAAGLFGLNGTVSKIVLGTGLSSLRLVELRSAGAAVCLVAVLLLTRPRSLATEPRELAFLAVIGVVGIGLVQWLYLVAIERLPVGIALLLEYLAPVIVALWVRFVRRERLKSRIWAGLALSVAGLALVAQVWQGMTLDGVGVLAALAAAVALATYYLTGERGLTLRDPLSLAAWTFT
ncbi:MAG: DMT family transporter, partial [Actinomycetes bacterium]